MNSLKQHLNHWAAGRHEKQTALLINYQYTLLSTRHDEMHLHKLISTQKCGVRILFVRFMKWQLKVHMSGKKNMLWLFSSHFTLNIKCLNQFCFFWASNACLSPPGLNNRTLVSRFSCTTLLLLGGSRLGCHGYRGIFFQGALLTWASAPRLRGADGPEKLDVSSNWVTADAQRQEHWLKLPEVSCTKILHSKSLRGNVYVWIH